MNLGNTARGETSIKLTRAELRILFRAGTLRSVAATVLGPEKAKAFIDESIVAYKKIEAEELAAEAAKAGAEELERPIIKQDRKNRVKVVEA